LDGTERRRLDLIRRFGTSGSLLMAVGALGAGAAPDPSQNPLNGVRLLGLPARMPTVALACAWAGIGVLVLAWLALGRYVRRDSPRRVTRSQLDRTFVMWALPLAVAPPLFSRDIYSYLAQTEIYVRGMDPYSLGPAQALGVDHPLTRGVPNIWRETPAPYGPFFFVLSKATAWLAEDDVVLGVLGQRVLALLGVGLIIWALPRLARRCGVPEVNALWLGALNPLVLFHLISGIHNEGMTIGLMLVGIEVVARALDRARTTGPPLDRLGGYRGLLGLTSGIALITLSSAVKIPSLVALGFVGVMMARRQGGRVRHLVIAAGGCVVVMAATWAVVIPASGLDFGWVNALKHTNQLRSWVSPVNALGFAGAGIGIMLELGNHTNSVIAVCRVVGMAGAAAIVGGLLWSSFRGRLNPLTGLGIALGAVVVLGPVLHPWYLLLTAIPLAATTRSHYFRVAATAVSAFLAVAVPSPGSPFFGRTFVLTDAIFGAAVITAVAIAFALYRLPGPPSEVLPAGTNRVGTSPGPQ
jgi:alpha-1,6-mannosyltransferase